MNRWENTSFGKAGRYYPILYLVPIPLLGVAWLLFGYALLDGFQLWERFVIAGFGLFFFVYFIKGIEAILITRSSIKEISVKNNELTIHTFGGKVLKIDRFEAIFATNDLFSKKNIQFMFAADVKHIIVRCESGNYYIAGDLDGIETLREALHRGSGLAL